MVSELSETQHFFSATFHLVKSFVLAGSEWPVLGERASCALHVGTNNYTKGKAMKNPTNNLDLIVSIPHTGFMMVVLRDPVSLQNFQTGRIQVLVVCVRFQTAVSPPEEISVDLVTV